MGILNNKINELNRLEEQYRQERDRVILAIESAVRSIGQNPVVKLIARNIFTIPVSELINAPWSPEFHDWTVQAERLLTLLKKKPVNQWMLFINELLDKPTKGNWSGIMVDKIQLNRKFILQVKEKL